MGFFADSPSEGGSADGTDPEQQDLQTVYCRTQQISEKARGHLQEVFNYPVPSK